MLRMIKSIVSDENGFLAVECILLVTAVVVLILGISSTLTF